jgi:hypothetical protein
VAYSPWSNGTVEVVNLSILKCLRSLLSEFKLKPSEWPKLVPLVQGVLNHSPSIRLSGMSPITIFTGLPPKDPFQVIFDSNRSEFRSSRLSCEDLLRLHEELSISLVEMHKKVLERKENSRRKAQETRNKHKKPVQVNFDIGDFVLVATVNPKDKLESRWKGPYRIVEVINMYVFKVEHLLTRKTKEVHAVRLRFFKDAELNGSSRSIFFTMIVVMKLKGFWMKEQRMELVRF